MDALFNQNVFVRFVCAFFRWEDGQAVVKQVTVGGAVGTRILMLGFIATAAALVLSNEPEYK